MDESVTRVLRSLPEWQVPLTQFNGLVADGLGVTQSELQCLYVLAQGPATAGELARRVTLSTGAASRMIDRLAAHGYVTRTPDPSDRRRVVIVAEQSALDRVAAFYGPLNERLAADLAGLDPAGLDALLRFVLAARDSTEAEIRRISRPTARSRPASSGTAGPLAPDARA